MDAGRVVIQRHRRRCPLGDGVRRSAAGVGATPAGLSHSAWLQGHILLAQDQYLYCSPFHNAFLQRRCAQKLNLAKKSPGNRGGAIRALLASAKLGSGEHAALVFAQTMDDEAKPLLEKLRFLWCAPKDDELLDA